VIIVRLRCDENANNVVRRQQAYASVQTPWTQAKVSITSQYQSASRTCLRTALTLGTPPVSRLQRLLRQAGTGGGYGQCVVRTSQVIDQPIRASRYTT